MNLLWLLVAVFVILALVGNPHFGPSIYPAYSYGYWPGGISVIVVIILLVLLLR
jgi:hypothetical protein